MNLDDLRQFPRFVFHIETIVPSDWCSAGAFHLRIEARDGKGALLGAAHKRVERDGKSSLHAAVAATIDELLKRPTTPLPEWGDNVNATGKTDVREAFDALDQALWQGLTFEL